MRRYLFATVVATLLVAVAVAGPSFAQTEAPSTCGASHAPVIVQQTQVLR